MLSDMTICFLLMLMCVCYGNHKLINEVQVNEHCGRWQFVSRSILYEKCDLLNKDRIWSLSFSSFLSFVDKSFQSLWSWSYGSWIYNYMCNQCLSQLTLLVQILLRWGVLETTLICDKVCQWLAAGRWFSSDTLVSSTNKTDHHNITELLLKVALNTINQKPNHLKFGLHNTYKYQFVPKF